MKPSDREKYLSMMAFASPDRRDLHAQRLADYREEILRVFCALQRQWQADPQISGKALDDLSFAIDGVRDA